MSERESGMRVCVQGGFVCLSVGVILEGVSMCSFHFGSVSHSWRVYKCVAFFLRVCVSLDGLSVSGCHPRGCVCV